MAKYGSDQLKIELADAGGTLRDITSTVTAVNGVNIEQITEETTPFGSSAQTHEGVGVDRMDDVELSGPMDDGTNTLRTLTINARGSTRSLKVTYGGTRATTVNAIIANYGHRPQRNLLTGYVCLLRPTGTATEV